jgi:AcrR family transcriptional regulator
MGQRPYQRLAKQDWIEAGLLAMAEGGADAVRVERLAETLRVTKGSFYWHFKDRKALLAALIAAWQAQATNDIIARVEAEGGNAAAQLRNLFTIVAQSDGQLDQAIRTWARRDAIARTALRQIDQRRLAYLDGLFRALGFAPADATARARLVYHALIGQFMIGAPSTSAERLAECLDIVYPMLVRQR